MGNEKNYGREEYYRRMYRIRYFEECLLTLFSQNRLRGTTHPYIGQEATAVAVMEQLDEADYVFSSHRCHGHFLEYAGRPDLLLSEIMGKEDGVCRGRGGSQHLAYCNFYSNGIQGGFTPNAAGMALAEKYKGGGGIAVCFIGDGTLGQGVVYESMNMAALYALPILYVIEENGYAMSTRTQDAVAGSIVQRIRGFGVRAEEIASNDVEVLRGVFKDAVDFVRSRRRPFCQIVHTYRLGPHSKGDDTRAPEEIRKHQDQDPLKILGERLGRTEAERIERQVREELDATVEACGRQQSETDPALCRADVPFISGPSGVINTGTGRRYLDALREGLRTVLRDDARVILLGEDIRDPYGGAFKVTKGLSAEFPDRVINTPISEAGFIGMAVGMAMGGLHPIVEVMFGDFITLGFDQILNHAVKYQWMYGGRVHVPLLIRTPMGGGRCYGATHSQTLEKHFIGIPGLRVLAASRLLDPARLLETINRHIEEPTLLIENKRMYAQPPYAVEQGRFQDFYAAATEDAYPIIRLTYDEQTPADGVIVTYGDYVESAVNAARQLMMEDELMVDVIAVAQIAPVDYEGLERLIGRVRNIITLEEGTRRAGWGAEIVAELAERSAGRRYLRIGALECPLAVNEHLENSVLPSEDEIYRKIRGMLL